MKNFIKFNTILLAVLLSFAAIQFMACNDPEPEPEPEPLDREIFIGTYLGNFQCPGILDAISSDSLIFSIDPAADPNDDDGIILNLTIEGNPIGFAGSVTGDTLFVMDLLENVTVPDLPLIGSITGDITGVGEATINDPMLSGQISLTMDSDDLGLLNPLMGDCTIVGVKQ